MLTGFLGRSRARSAVVSTTAPPPSVTRQQSAAVSGEEWDEDDDPPSAPIPIHERTWRHPSELGPPPMPVAVHQGPVFGRTALIGAGVLIGLVVGYVRAGKFAPPRSVFTVSTILLYALSVVFAGQGISALQTTGHLPLHPVSLPNLPALGVYPTIETYVVQITLVALALVAAWLARPQGPPAGPSAPGDTMARSREGVKL